MYQHVEGKDGPTWKELVATELITKNQAHDYLISVLFAQQIVKEPNKFNDTWRHHVAYVLDKYGPKFDAALQEWKKNHLGVLE